MENVFAKVGDFKEFNWSDLGDIKGGRGDLGEEMPVVLYRLMQFTIINVLSKEFGVTKAYDIIRDAGKVAGCEYAKNVLDTSLGIDDFLTHIQVMLRELKVGIVRFEKFEHDTGAFTLTVAEDLDCSGLPITGDNVCVYDEGLIAGILEVYSGKPYSVKEVDCWASGGRICRFNGEPI